MALAFGALADEDDAEPVSSGFREGCADDLAFASAVARLAAALSPTALNTSDIPRKLGVQCSWGSRGSRNERRCMIHVLERFLSAVVEESC